MKIVPDPDVCTGHGRCYLLVPELFADDKFGHGFLSGSGVLAEEQMKAAQKAVDSCPERAISIVAD